MLDVKILAAVLATLTALAAGTGGGDVQNRSNYEIPDEIGTSSFSNPLDTVRDLFSSKPEPETDIEASLTVESLYREDIDIGRADVYTNISEIEAGKQVIDSDDEIELYGYSGSLKFGNGTQLDGSTNRIETSGVDIEGSTKITHNFGKNRFELKNVSDTAFKFQNVKGSISSGDAEASFGNSSKTLNINSFSGESIFYPKNKSLYLSGKVGKLNYGSFKFGG